jgi:hypothetical protein
VQFIKNINHITIVPEIVYNILILMYGICVGKTFREEYMNFRMQTKEELMCKKEQIKDQIMANDITWQQRMELYAEVRMINDQMHQPSIDTPAQHASTH